MSVRSRRPRSQRMSSSCSTCPDDFGQGTQNKKRPDDHFCNSVQLVRQGWCQATMTEKGVFGDWCYSNNWVYLTDLGTETAEVFKVNMIETPH